MARRKKTRQAPHTQPCESAPSSPTPSDETHANPKPVTRQEGHVTPDYDRSNPFTIPPQIYFAGYAAHQRAKREGTPPPLLISWRVRNPRQPKPRGGRPKKLFPETLERLREEHRQAKGPLDVTAVVRSSRPFQAVAGLIDGRLHPPPPRYSADNGPVKGFLAGGEPPPRGERTSLGVCSARMALRR